MPKRQDEKPQHKIAAFWPVGAGKVLVGRQVETPNGRQPVTKKALLEAIKAIDLDETNGLELVVYVNSDRDDEKYPIQTLYVKEAWAKPDGNKGGKKLTPPRGSAQTADDADDDIPF